MSGSHHATALHQLAVPGHSLVHRLAPQAKLVGLVTFVVTVAVTPRHAVAVFGIDAAVLAAVLLCSGIGVRTAAVRVLVVATFLLAALFVPFVAHGTKVDVFGVSLSVEGLWAAFNIAIKAVLGAGAAVILSATTPLPELLAALGRLRVPAVFVAIVASMIRYVDLLADQLARMRTAMVARCHDPRWLWQLRPIASSLGVVFVRSYERGERVHLAMASRGFDGTMPVLHERSVTRSEWALGLTPGVVAIVALVGWLVLR